MPTIGVPIAFHNPTFVDDVDRIMVTKKEKRIYTRVAVKKNGYRLQLLIGRSLVFRTVGDISAFTHQFVQLDLRMFPKLHEMYSCLPIMIDDTELIKPQFIVDTDEPILLEARVFDIKWIRSPMPAGFHTWHGDSFHFSNCFAERTRPDKTTATDCLTIYSFVRKNTDKKGKKNETKISMAQKHERNNLFTRKKILYYGKNLGKNKKEMAYG